MNACIVLNLLKYSILVMHCRWLIIFETYLINLAAKDKHRNMKRMYSLTPALFILLNSGWAQNGMVVFQTDFGLKDGAVSAMKGVAMQVSPALKLYDLTHEIPAYNTYGRLPIV